MPELLHEYWENDEGGEFGPVGRRSDELRSHLTPDARKAFELRAPSWHEAMQLRNDRLGYSAYMPIQGVEDYVYTDEERAEQDAYLAVRKVR